MNASLHFAPLLDWSDLAMLALAFLAAAAFALARRARGAWWRLALFAVLTAALAGPRLTVAERQSLPDIALVLVDDSPSNRIDGRAERSESALAAVRERLARLPNLEVRVERVAGTDQGTRLFEAADRALADIGRRRLAGIVAITDGRIHDASPPPRPDAPRLDAPLHVLLTGTATERDRRLTIVRQPGFALVGKSAPITLRIDDPGQSAPVRLTVAIDGTPLIDAPQPVNRDLHVDIPIRHGGANLVELTAQPAAGELSDANNRQLVSVSGVRDRLKVLLVSGEPHAGERAWRNLLKADPSVDLVHFTILRPPEKDDLTPIRELSLITFPVRELFEEKLPDFDLVVFDRYRGRGILTGGYYQALADYVRKGGALLVSVGPEFAEPGALSESSLGAVLPAAPTGQVIEKSFRPRLAEIGRRHPVSGPLAATEAGWGPWVRQIAVGPSAGQTVLTGTDGRPLLVLNRVGDGRVGLLLSDTAWLWARGHEGGGPHDELLRRLAHWLMQEPELEEEALAAEIRAGRLEVTRRTLADQAGPITVTRPDGSSADHPLTAGTDGAFHASLAADQPGLWRVSDGPFRTVAAHGGANPLEMGELTATTAILAPIAAASRGSITQLAKDGIPDIRRVTGGGATAGNGWIGVVARDEFVVTGARDVPLFTPLLLLILSLATILAAWWREGR
ncbi:conserved membrane hypothetical protein [Magnetospirillum sp. LM-5]|uniref:hypothetical protein n=1 Tax=Magnetospirillum sp. LM-5 TaxID=2681466 RepID=UPI001382B8E3|nr:hypothetical protein [Magnetospirillum sp. LM-5]CAA7619459.1 conserved membrane hypothetical protein [Magnetospirillum sp. LM-5]